MMDKASAIVLILILKNHGIRYDLFEGARLSFGSLYVIKAFVLHSIQHVAHTDFVYLFHVQIA